MAILAAAMSADDDVDTSEAHQVQAIQDIETLGDPRDLAENIGQAWALLVDPQGFIGETSHKSNRCHIDHI